MKLTRFILFTLCLMLAAPVWATSPVRSKSAAAPQAVTKTDAPSAPAQPEPPAPAPAVSFDDKVQREADDRVRRAEGELTYLGAAYLAAFLILGIFLWSSRKGQQRLADEVKELQDRVDQALSAKPGGDA